MNRKQRRALLVGLAVALLMVVFPPYEVEGVLFGGVGFAPFWSPPWNEGPDITRLRYDIVWEQLQLVVLLTFWAALIYGSRLDARRRIIHRVGLAAETLTLVPGAYLCFTGLLGAPALWHASITAASVTIAALLLPPRGGRGYWPRLP
jgi:hypothetical protein